MLALRCSACKEQYKSNGDYIIYKLVLECLLLFKMDRT